MENNSNQFSFTMNQGEEQRKNSEIPHHMFDSNPQGQVGKKTSSDDEKRTAKQNKYQNNLPSPHLIKLEKNNWKVDTSRFTNSMFDENRFIASKQIAKQIYKPISYMTLLLVVVSIFISGFKGNGFLLINLCPDHNDQGNEWNDEVDGPRNHGGFILRAFWRQILMTIFLVPFVLYEYTKEKSEEIEDLRLYSRQNLLDGGMLMTIVFCGLAYSVWIGSMAYSIFNTSVANTYIFTNAYPLFLFFAKFLPKEQASYQNLNENEANYQVKKGIKPATNRMEIGGSILTVLVLVLLVSDNPKQVITEMIALGGALAASIYSNYLSRIVFSFPWMFAVFLLSLVSSIYFGAYTLIFENSTLDMDQFHGLFGVFTWKWIFFNIFISLLTGVVNVRLFSYISQLISTLYLDIAIMAEVFAAMIIALCLGYTHLPTFEQVLIYIVYIFAQILLAYGKDDAQFEEIHLHEEQQQAPLMVPLASLQSKGIIHVQDKDVQNKQPTNIINSNTSYNPPVFFQSHIGKDQISNPRHILQYSARDKKNTIAIIEQDISMYEFNKRNRLESTEIEPNPLTSLKKPSPPPSDTSSQGIICPPQNNNIIYEQEETNLTDSIDVFNRNFIQQMKNKKQNI